MKKALIFLSFCLLCLSEIMAQEIVSGTVIDSKKEPVPGVRVEIVGRSEYTTTDIDGRFKIELPAPAKKVRFIYPGISPIEEKIKPDMVITLGNGWKGKSHGYRGFYDFNGGVGIGGRISVHAGATAIEDIGAPILFGYTMSHGYQFNRNLFVGLGFGVHASLFNGTTYYHDYERENSYKIATLNVSLFADARWDFGLAKKTAPYVGLKLGYMVGVAANDEDGYYGEGLFSSYLNGYLDVYPKRTNGILLMPSVGFRTSMGSKRGFNIGLAYNALFRTKFNATYEPNGYDIQGNPLPGFEEKDLGASTWGVLMLTFGFDW